MQKIRQSKEAFIQKTNPLLLNFATIIKSSKSGKKRNDAVIIPTKLSKTISIKRHKNNNLFDLTKNFDANIQFLPIFNLVN